MWNIIILDIVIYNVYLSPSNKYFTYIVIKNLILKSQKIRNLYFLI